MVSFFKTNISELNQDQYVRFDIDYIEFKRSIRDVNFKYLKDYVKNFETGQPITRDDYSEEGERTDYIHLVVRNIKNGELDLKDPIYIKEEKGLSLSSFKIEKGDIVVAISANCGASFYFENIVEGYQLTLSHYLAKFKVNTDLINPRLLAYYLNSKTIQKYFRATETGKTQKNLSKTYLRELPILLPTDINKQNEIFETINLFEFEISKLKNSKINQKYIINQVVSDEFNIYISDVASIDGVAKLNVKLSSISPRNNNLRDSFRWNKMQHIQNFLYKDIDCIHLLGNFIIETKNGWSPLSVDGGEGIPVLGQEHFSIDGVLKISPSKFTEVTKNNIDDYFIQQGDFFVSRGNTVDLVALASVVEEEISEDIIFPDLYIKIQLDETRIDKKYLALLFNSFFGRLYFKCASKGKNQTMVKISSSELYDFYLPIPDIEIQRQVVKKIQTQIDAQSHIDREIENNMAKINLIIEEAIRNPANV